MTGPPPIGSAQCEYKGDTSSSIDWPLSLLLVLLESDPNFYQVVRLTPNFQQVVAPLIVLGAIRSRVYFQNWTHDVSSLTPAHCVRIRWVYPLYERPRSFIHVNEEGRNGTFAFSIQ